MSAVILIGCFLGICLLAAIFFRQKSLPTSNDLQEDMDITTVPSEPTDDEIAAVRKHIESHEQVELSVHGESKINSDGTPRQEIIALLAPGQDVKLVREPNNEYDRNAVRVDAEDGTIGYVAAFQAGEIAAVMDSGRKVECMISAIMGGTKNKSFYGVRLVAFYPK